MNNTHFLDKENIPLVHKKSKQEERLYLLIVILIFTILCMGFIFINPIFEANDESGHFQYAFYISKYNRIPSVYNEPISREDYIKKYIDENPTDVFYMDGKYMFFIIRGANYYSDERHHPPIYYLISSQIIKPFKVNNIYVESNWPYSKRGYDFNIYKNNIIWQNQSQTFMLVLILRMFQLIYGIITIIFIYKILKLLFRDNIDKYSILLISSIAFLPQFTFLYSYVNNDALSYLFGLISIYFIMLLFERKKVYFGLIAILIAGFASFTKLTMLVMLPLVILTFFIWLIINKKLKVILIFLILIPIAILISLFILSSKSLSTTYIYQNILAKGKGAINDSIKNFSIDRFLSILPKSFKSCIGYFGWFYIPVENFIYHFYITYILSGIILFLSFIKKQKNNLVKLTFIIISIISIFIYFTMYATTNYVQTAGRIFFLAVILTFILSIVGYNNIKLPFKKILGYSLFSYFIIINIFCLYYHIYLNYY